MKKEPVHWIIAVLFLSFTGISCSVERTVPGGANPTAAWILACRVGDGGFGCYPGDSAFTSRTGMALEALAELGKLEHLEHKAELVSWLRARQQADGGFIEADDYYYGKTLPWGTTSALEPTYWAAMSLKLLGSMPERPEAAAGFIRGRLKENGGYDAWEYAFGGAPEALYTTFWAVGALKEMGLPVPDSAKTIEWVLSMQDTQGDRGGFSLSNDSWKYSSPAGCYYALRILNLFGVQPKRPAQVKEFLLSPYGQEADGGFEVGHHRGWRQEHYSRMEDTHSAVGALELLGLPLSDSDSSRAASPRADCIRWVSGVQNADGGFGRFGLSERTPLPCPSEMRATWQAVETLTLLGAEIPVPENPVKPAAEIQEHQVRYGHPCVDRRDPAEVWAYRRIALPIYEHFLKQTGSRLAALGMVNQWASAAVGPHNGAWIVQGRGILMHGWGQCGTMSWLLQEMVTCLDYPSRPSFIIADVNCEMLVQEQTWDQAHWCLFVPFTNEYPNPGLACPDGEKNGWSLLDMVVDYSLRKKDRNRPRPTQISDRLFAEVRLEKVDTERGAWGKEYSMDSLTTYSSPVADSLYPGKTW